MPLDALLMPVREDCIDLKPLLAEAVLTFTSTSAV